MTKRLKKTDEQIIAAWHEKNPRRESPCIEQTEADVAAYYRNAQAGSVAVVRHTQGGQLTYTVTEIEDVNPQRGRVYLKGGDRSFYSKSGKNCFHPKGQTRLVVPTEAVLAWAKENPRGQFEVYHWGENRKGLL